MVGLSTIIISICISVSGIVAIASYPKVEHYLEVQNMRKKIKKLIEEIDEKDPEALHNIICESTPDLEGYEIL